MIEEAAYLASNKGLLITDTVAADQVLCDLHLYFNLARHNAEGVEKALSAWNSAYCKQRPFSSFT